MGRWFALGLLLLTLTGCAAGKPEAETVFTTTAAMETTAAAAETTAETEPPETEPQPERFYLTFAGDCTLGCNAANYYAGQGFIKTVGEDYSYPFYNVMPYFISDDFTMVNLEGPLCDQGNPVEKKHTFHGPTAYTAILTENSVEAVTIANNHSQDFGLRGYESTVAALENAGMPYVEHLGTRLVTTDRGLVIGLYAMTYANLDAEKMEAAIADLREQGAEVVVAAFHWGVEGTYRPTPQQTELGHRAIDAGADIVFGSHPHVLQPIEEYNGGIIYYSLGNFAFGGNGAPRDLDTALLRQEVLRQPDGTIELGVLERVPASVSSVSGRNNFQPAPYEPGTAEYDRVLSKLDGTFDGPNLEIG